MWLCPPSTKTARANAVIKSAGRSRTTQKSRYFASRAHIFSNRLCSFADGLLSVTFIKSSQSPTGCRHSTVVSGVTPPSETRPAISFTVSGYGSSGRNTRRSTSYFINKVSSGTSRRPAARYTSKCADGYTGCPTIRTVESRIDACSICSIFSTDTLLVLCPSRTMQSDSDYGSPHTSKSIGTQTASYTSRSDNPLRPKTQSNGDITRSRRNSLTITYPTGNTSDRKNRN